MHTLDDEPLTLPDAWEPPPRPPVPIVAAIVPVIGAVVLWLVTGSVLALLLAGLGPLIAVAGILDGARGNRRERRRALVRAGAARERVERTVAERQDRERAERRSRHPDVAGFSARDGEVWRRDPDRLGAVVVGAGEMPSAVRVTGGDGDPDAAALRTRAGRLTRAPVLLAADVGLAVVGEGPAAVAAHRALVLQACLVAPPGELRVVGELDGDPAWLAALPHRRAPAPTSFSVSARTPADRVVALVRPGETPPPACGASLTVASPTSARLDHRGVVRDVEVEAVGADQALALASALAARAEGALGLVPTRDDPVAFADVVSRAPAARRGTLPAVLGEGGDGAPCVVDLVLDGPHAVVAGVTGAGKSELLITWVLALAATHTTEEVSFLLADFKGGTAFDGLRGLPHVTGVLTDLDGRGARRAIESLRAEVRRRESALADAGARDVSAEGVGLPRLVVVVDEFAALLTEHPELHAVFADVAARGRALGMHLVLGTQRVAGVVRDALLANCPLRVSLRVTDAADSRAVVGTDEAALLSGDPRDRGVALVRRAADRDPQRVRIALSNADDVAEVALRTTGPAPRRPWLPDLPTRIPLADLPPRPGELLVGLADEPDRQRQVPLGIRRDRRGLLVVGGSGTGKSTALATLAAQAATVIRVPPSAEGAWDAVAALDAQGVAPGTIVVVDDLDALAQRFPPEYAHVLVERLERVFRGGAGEGVCVVASAERMSGPAARLGELLPHRLVLAHRSRTEHLAAGGDPAHFAPDAPPGRGRLDGVAVQVALSGAPPVGLRRDRPARPRAWEPAGVLTGLVTRRRQALEGALAAWAAGGAHVVDLGAYLADPSVVAAGRTVVVGDPDAWQREWRLLAEVRGDHDLVIDTSCAGDHRALASTREPPPYAEPGAGRAWLHRAGADPVRIVLVS